MLVLQYATTGLFDPCMGELDIPSARRGIAVIVTTASVAALGACPVRERRKDGGRKLPLQQWSLLYFAILDKCHHQLRVMGTPLLHSGEGKSPQSGPSFPLHTSVHGCKKLPRVKEALTRFVQQSEVRGLAGLHTHMKGLIGGANKPVLLDLFD